ncbi:hypothetical protein [Desulfonema magnum]|uniref:PIN domain-containing protein n=1 Tax=Desulfonema magnum TaxID=45655 RepID=A0A975BFG0_9BACT|nr:hypothetical protein [Desulfonema magnum]QTA84085.1 Uncharacterized protein dnm_000770 [Desulfonema magnum]
MRKVIIFDTSVLCCWLKVPGKSTCGGSNDRWDFTRINEKVEEELKNKSTFVLPLATIIETGNHIAQAHGNRYDIAKKLSDLILKAATETEPWAAFEHQSELWNEKRLKELADKWPNLASQGLGIGDATIKEVAEYYSEIGFNVEILTGDQGLKVYQPAEKTIIPRRRG